MQIIDEDGYWERRREEMEQQPKGWETELDRKILSLDDEIEDLESEYGCSLEELDEPDLEEIVFRIRGVYPESVEYDSNLLAIFYEVAA